MERDYISFSGIAKVRFRKVAAELGYTQITGTTYEQDCGEWANVFALQKAQYGNDFFYVNYGVAIPSLWNLEATSDSEKSSMVISRRLSNAGRGAFDCKTKKEVEESALLFLAEYEQNAIPDLAPLQNLEAIAESYYKSKNIDWDLLGQHEWASQLGAAGYGFFLFKLGRLDDALLWLKEAKRLMELPIYYLRNGGMSHTKEKYARLAKKDDSELRQIEKVKLGIQKIENS